jgi:hypothetical protein
MDMEILRFDDSKRSWVWHVKGEQGVTQICRVPPNKSPSESLYDFYNGNQRFKDDLQSVLISKKPKLDKKSKVTEPEDVDEKDE